jgi:hypothetical protein
VAAASAFTFAAIDPRSGAMRPAPRDGFTKFGSCSAFQFSQVRRITEYAGDACVDYRFRGVRLPTSYDERNCDRGERVTWAEADCNAVGVQHPFQGIGYYDGHGCGSWVPGDDCTTARSEWACLRRGEAEEFFRTHKFERTRCVAGLLFYVWRGRSVHSPPAGIGGPYAPQPSYRSCVLVPEPSPSDSYWGGPVV